MVKKGNKNFKSGLDAIIQSTAVTEEPELNEVKGTDATAGTKGTSGKEAKEKEKQITITIPASLKRSIKKFCANNEITIKDLFINSVNRYMNN